MTAGSSSSSGLGNHNRSAVSPWIRVADRANRSDCDTTASSVLLHPLGGGDVGRRHLDWWAPVTNLGAPRPSESRQPSRYAARSRVALEILGPHVLHFAAAPAVHDVHHHQRREKERPHHRPDQGRPAEPRGVDIHDPLARVRGVAATEYAVGEQWNEKSRQTGVVARTVPGCAGGVPFR